MKNRTYIKVGELDHLKQWLTSRGWCLLDPIGEWEVLRAVNRSYPRPLLIHTRKGLMVEPMAGLSIDDRDAKVYKPFRKMMDERYRKEGYMDVLHEKQEV